MVSPAVGGFIVIEKEASELEQVPVVALPPLTRIATLAVDPSQGPPLPVVATVVSLLKYTVPDMAIPGS
jgi:hypothetical protein